MGLSTQDIAARRPRDAEIAEAVQHFRELLKLAPERNEVRLKLGTILAVEGRAAEAAEISKSPRNLIDRR
jgi:Flp pilus assembly protein TadD